MGTHGRRGLARLALGSDAEQVVRGATSPVLLIRSTPKDADKTANVTPNKASAVRLMIGLPPCEGRARHPPLVHNVHVGKRAL